MTVSFFLFELCQLCHESAWTQAGAGNSQLCGRVPLAFGNVRLLSPANKTKHTAQTDPNRQIQVNSSTNRFSFDILCMAGTW